MLLKTTSILQIVIHSYFDKIKEVISYEKVEFSFADTFYHSLNKKKKM